MFTQRITKINYNQARWWTYAACKQITTEYTRWFKYDRDKLWLVYTQIVPVISEPPCTYYPYTFFVILHTSLMLTVNSFHTKNHRTFLKFFSICDMSKNVPQNTYTTHALISCAVICLWLNLDLMSSMGYKLLLTHSKFSQPLSVQNAKFKYMWLKLIKYQT
jgi:hypothetical protein